MKNKGLSTVELLVVMAIFVVVLTSIVLTSISGIRATTLSNTIAYQAATINNALASLGNQISSSNIDAITIKTCGSEECYGEKLSYKIPVIDATPVANSMYTPDDKIKFGANVNGEGRQNCRYEFMVAKIPDHQLVKNIICEDSLEFCGNGYCELGSESLANCPQDCGECGDGTCSAVIGETLGSCLVDCRECGDSICSPGENCDETFECQADCGSCTTPGPGGGCFLAGTPITMKDGTTKPIETVKVGDKVLSFDFETKQFKPDKVTKVLKHISDEYWIVNGHWKVTPNHPVYSNGRWTQIGKLKIGDVLFGSDGRAQPIEKIFRIREKVKTYNFEVNPYHTYISGGYVVHNGGGGDGGAPGCPPGCAK